MLPTNGFWLWVRETSTDKYNHERTEHLGSKIGAAMSLFKHRVQLHLQKQDDVKSLYLYQTYYLHTRLVKVTFKNKDEFHMEFYNDHYHDLWSNMRGKNINRDKKFYRDYREEPQSNIMIYRKIV